MGFGIGSAAQKFHPGFQGTEAVEIETRIREAEWMPEALKLPSVIDVGHCLTLPVLAGRQSQVHGGIRSIRHSDRTTPALYNIMFTGGRFLTSIARSMYRCC